MGISPEQSNPEKGSEIETFRGIPLEELGSTQRYDYLVSRKQSILPLARAAVLMPVVEVDLYAAQVDRVFAGNGERYGTKHLRRGVEAAFRHAGAELTLPFADVFSEEMRELIEKKSGLDPRHTWQKYDEEAIALENNPQYYWDGLLARVGAGDCRPSELQLALDTFHAVRHEFALVEPRKELVLQFAGHLYETFPLRFTPHQRALRKVEEAIAGFANTVYPGHPGVNNARFTQVVAEAYLRQARGQFDKEDLMNPHDKARDRRLLTCVKFLSDSQMRGYPAEARTILQGAAKREHERAAIIEKQGLALGRAAKAFVGAALGVRSIQPDKE